MPSAITKIGILNRAAQLLGQPAISNLNEDSRSAKSLIRAYDTIFLAEIEAHVWGFTVRRANLAAEATLPAHGVKNYYPLPGDFLYLAPEEVVSGVNPRKHDYEIEVLNNTLCLVSEEAAPVPIRYVSSNINESLFSANFAEALSAALALATCEDITNSNTKVANLERTYEKVVRRAKRRNDIQQAPKKSPTCSWISVRT